MKPIVGIVRANLEPVRGIPPRPFVVTVACLICEEPFVVDRGAVHAVLRCGNEVISIICDDCLVDEDRENLVALRERAKAASR